jgi:hypothetical protein
LPPFIEVPELKKASIKLENLNGVKNCKKIIIITITITSRIMYSRILPSIEARLSISEQPAE